MLISKDGIKDDGEKLTIILRGEKSYTVSELAIVEGVSSSNMRHRINKHLKGEVEFDEIFSMDFTKKVHVVIVAGTEFTYKTLMKRYGCKKENAYKRLREYEKSEKGLDDYKRLTAKAKNYGNREKGVEYAFTSEREREKLAAIPSCGTWEEANLGPTTFCGGTENGGLDCRLNTTVV